MSQRQFYAQADDCVRLLATVEARVSLAYHQMGNFTSAPPAPVRSWAHLEAVGLADASAGHACRSYLVAPADQVIHVRTLAQGPAGTRRLVDQLLNPGTVTLTLGGLWDERVLLPGRVGTVHDDETARRLMKIFESGLRASSFVRMGQYFVGPGAITFLRAGGRLTPAVQSPSEYDLVIPPGVRS